MTRANRPATLNRSVLASTGALLTAGGGLVVAVHSGWLDHPGTGPGLVPGTAAPPAWVVWTVIVGAVVLGLLCLRWLIAQFSRMPKPVSWHLDPEPSTGDTVLSSKTVAAAVAADIQSYTDVEHAGAWLTGPHTAPRLHLSVTAAPDADITDLRRRIRDDAVAQLGRALQTDQITVGLELRVATADRRARLH
ncbi:alkaline shock response membrane anchor protein AmaP [Nocardia sp. NBC_01329]|uniref:alkaline shock response membrane anchor protein AmaP n=1 Tax=Nocardia sp. NBC_01329 TaxID=2903594 RepID=UPI002E0F4940|nr:alkaline shock response membrane anchor protein AmaP [Nocardia sp. NBC_01329]